MNVENIIKENQGTVVDVRTPGEFMGGNVEGSVNIPLQDLSNRIAEVKSLSAPIVLCCASGGRSGMATGMLTEQGVECCNGGSWMDVNYYKNQNS